MEFDRLNEIIKENWEYVLYQSEAGDLYFSVVCGTVGLYDLDIKLTEQGKLEFESEGTVFLDTLAEEVRTYPSRYKDRQVKLNL